MRTGARTLRVCVVVTTLVLLARTLFAQATPGRQLRIVLLVDSSAAVSSMLPQFRNGLSRFLDALPGEPEVVFITTGGQLRVRVQPTSDRAKLHAAVTSFAADGGGNVFMDALLEADKRFLKSAPERRPVFVILTTDAGETTSDQSVTPFNRFVRDFLQRNGRAHAIIVGGKNRGITSDLVENLVGNTSGFINTIVIANAVPDTMEKIAAYVAADQ
jgi:hypothetical protein